MTKKLTKDEKAKQKSLYNSMVSPEPYKEPARLDVSLEDLPAIKGWDVGKTYKLELTGKMISKSEGGYDGKQPLKACFEIKNASEDTDGED